MLHEEHTLKEEEKESSGGIIQNTRGLPWHSKHAILESYAINSNAPYSDSRYININICSTEGEVGAPTAYYIGKTVTAPTVYTES